MNTALNCHDQYSNGRTLYLGKKVNGKELCIYEKGKQLGNPESEWLRIEIRFGNRDRVIPHDVVLDPTSYFAGGFIALEHLVDSIAQKIKTNTNKRDIAVEERIIVLKRLTHFVSGSQVSILGAILTNQNGSTQQSYDRVESGTILEISPVVRDQGVDIDLFQQVSSFVNIDGNSQPTLNKRELRTSLTVRDGEVVVIAGLDDLKEDDSRSGLSFLPFALAKSRNVRKSQLVLVLEMTRITADASALY